jgi:hypothetical protein
MGRKARTLSGSIGCWARAILTFLKPAKPNTPKATSRLDQRILRAIAGIKRTRPALLVLARHIVHNHLMDYVDEGDFEEDSIHPHVEQCVAQFATWPEALTMTCLLRDLDPEDFYHA